MELNFVDNFNNVITNAAEAMMGNIPYKATVKPEINLKKIFSDKLNDENTLTAAAKVTNKIEKFWTSKLKRVNIDPSSDHFNLKQAFFKYSLLALFIQYDKITILSKEIGSRSFGVVNMGF